MKCFLIYVFISQKNSFTLMALKQTTFLKIFFDIKEIYENICSYVPETRRLFLKNIYFWIEKCNHQVLSHIDPYYFCDISVQDWLIENGICWFHIYVPRLNMCDIMNSNEKCQQVILEKFQQIIIESNKLSKKHNQSDDNNIYRYDIDSIKTIIQEYHRHTRKQELFGHFLTQHLYPFKGSLEDVLDWINYHENDELIKERNCDEYVVDNIIHFKNKGSPQFTKIKYKHKNKNIIKYKQKNKNKKKHKLIYKSQIN